MKKLLILVLSFVVLALPSFVSAKSQQAQGNAKPSPKTEKSINANKAIKLDISNETAKEKTAAKKLLLVAEEVDDPEVEQEVEELADDQEQVETESQQLVEEVDERPSFVKFLIGPDYKNLGQLRSNIVHIENNIRKLEKIQERADADELPAIEVALLELEESASALKADMYSKLSEFSLFGWLFRWLSNFTPETTATPAPSATPVGSPSGSPDASPVATPVVTASPTPTSSPTI